MKEEINKLLKLPADLLEVFWTSLKPAAIQKGNFFPTEGEYCRNIALVIKGALYSYYQKEENEIIEGFCFEGCFLADYPSFINKTPAQKNFRAIENAQLLLISNDKLEKLYQQDPRFEKAGRLMAEFLFTQWELKLRETIFLTPTERYIKLLSDKKDVLQRVPQYQIASYLNITPQYLSQIRKNIIS
jgi:CRP-like cAMP-binding protein